MRIWEALDDRSEWERFFANREETGRMPEWELKKLRRFLDEERYLEALPRLLAAYPAKEFRREAVPEPALLPLRQVVNKKGSTKKRVVYSFSGDSGFLLKYLAFLLHRYDGFFSRQLYSFRAGAAIRQALSRLRRKTEGREWYVYKADIHDYFNSVDVELLLPQLKRVLSGEEEVYRLLESMLLSPWVRDGGSLTLAEDGEEDAPYGESEEEDAPYGEREEEVGPEEAPNREEQERSGRIKGEKTVLREAVIRDSHKGIMAGVPVSSFLANLYLSEMDRDFEARGILYARYSDDIILFLPTEEMREQCAEEVRAWLSRCRLTLNPAKEERWGPGEGWTFLGIRCREGETDLSPVSLEKMKAKMRRKARALVRWAARKGVSGEKAAKAYIRAMNRKLYGSGEEKDLTWTRWYFPLITTDRSLRILDEYFQSCIRYVVTGRHRKGNYRIRYETLKAWGYRNLVHSYYEKDCD